jgi:hypothetical protein
MKIHPKHIQHIIHVASLRTIRIQHVFVDIVPKTLDLYVLSDDSWLFFLYLQMYLKSYSTKNSVWSITKNRC